VTEDVAFINIVLYVFSFNITAQAKVNNTMTAAYSKVYANDA